MRHHDIVQAYEENWRKRTKASQVIQRRTFLGAAHLHSSKNGRQTKARNRKIKVLHWLQNPLDYGSLSLGKTISLRRFVSNGVQKTSPYDSKIHHQQPWFHGFPSSVWRKMLSRRNSKNVRGSELPVLRLASSKEIRSEGDFDEYS